MLTTDFTTLLNIKHPVVLAGMGQVAGAHLVAAVSNAGGLGVLGGALYTPQMLKDKLDDMKKLLRDPSLPFGVDLLFPQLGGSARKTNVDYTKGQFDELIDVIIESGAKMFVCAVGVPPKHIVDKLHAAGVFYMNIVGHPKHVHKACAVGADLICVQGGEAGGHTGDIPTSILVPACVEAAKKYVSPLTGHRVQVIAGGGVYDGKSLAACLILGATAVWVGTRFITAAESDAPEDVKQHVINANLDSTIRTTIFTGRPLRTISTPYIENWEKNRQKEMQDLQSQGIIPCDHELDEMDRQGKLTEEFLEGTVRRPTGIVAGLITTRDEPAALIVNKMVDEATVLLDSAKGVFLAKL